LPAEVEIYIPVILELLVATKQILVANDFLNKIAVPPKGLPEIKPVDVLTADSPVP